MSEGYPVGVLQADLQWIDDDYRFGIRIAVLEIEWSRWEPTEGQFDQTYIDQQVAKMNAYLDYGFQVGIVSGIHHQPSWVLAKSGIQHEDQNGTQSGILDFQFNDQARSYGENFLTSLVQAFGSAVSFHRVGLSAIGETLYPEAPDNNWWAFSDAAQATSPHPGWVPGTAADPGEAEEWYDWYFEALVDAHDWMLATIRAAGYTGTVHYVTPGKGANPAHVAARLAGDLAPIDGDTYFVMNTGAIWYRFYDQLADLTGCEMNISSVYDVSGSPRGNVTEPGDDLVPFDDSAMDSWSSVRYLSSIARRHGLERVGENPADTMPIDVQGTFDAAWGCGLKAILWAFDNQLRDGVHGRLAQIAQEIVNNGDRPVDQIFEVEDNMAVAKSGTLTAGSAIDVTVDVDAFGPGTGFAVTNRSDAGTIWVRLDGTDAVAEADNNFPVLGTRVFSTQPGNRTVTVSLITEDADVAYTVEGRG